MCTETRLRTPYDTGKVKIGLLYTPRPRYPSDPDMERLQHALLSSAPGPRSVVSPTLPQLLVDWVRQIVRGLS